MRFVSRISPRTEARTRACWFVFQGDRLLVRQNGDTLELPVAVDPMELGLATVRDLYLGYMEDEGGESIDCYAAELAPSSAAPESSLAGVTEPDAGIPDGLMADGLRQLYGRLDEPTWVVAGRAVQVVAWDRTHQYCGQCGSRTENMPSERAKRCPECGLISYPRLSPAIIIAVVRHTEEGDRLLLARNHRFPPGRYSVVAGYVEPGETLEACAQREVLEEVGIRIKSIRYFGSQPWPFPNSLMIGFTAEYESGEFVLEEAEIAEAGWFAADALPGLPPKMSIARQLIDWFSAGMPAF
jgi:NAD+ diphosphatase